jgi:hypothetical protein
VLMWFHHADGICNRIAWPTLLNSLWPPVTLDAPTSQLSMACTLTHPLSVDFRLYPHTHKYIHIYIHIRIHIHIHVSSSLQLGWDGCHAENMLWLTLINLCVLDILLPGGEGFTDHPLALLGTDSTCAYNVNTVTLVLLLWLTLITCVCWTCCYLGKRGSRTTPWNR